MKRGVIDGEKSEERLRATEMTERATERQGERERTREREREREREERE